MKNSFVKKMMIGIISIVSVVYLLQLLITRMILPGYFLFQTRNSIENTIDLIPDNISTEDSESLLNIFSERTATTNTIINLSEDTLSRLRLPTIEVQTDTESYVIALPELLDVDIKENMQVVANIISIENQYYVPALLEINGEVVFAAMEGFDMMRGTHQMHRFLDRNTIAIEGTITDVSTVFSTQSDRLKTNSELINFLSGNVTDTKEYDNGYSYISVDKDDNPVNLVYATFIQVDHVEKLLLTIYPLSSITAYTTDITQFNLFTFVILISVLVLFFYVYLRRISIPLLKINEVAKGISKLEFNTVSEIESDDEIGELSKSINIVSKNLQNSLQTLEKQNETLSNSLSQEVEREKMRQDFVAGISHELKTPLAVIQATNEAMNHGVIDQSEYAKHHKVIEKEIERSNKIIQDMIQVYNFDQITYKERFKVQDIQPVLLESLDVYKPLIEAKNIQLTKNITESDWNFDREKILLVFNNLLSNAIKYTSDTGRIHVEINKNGFSIFNTHELVDEAILEKLFEPFYRIDSSRTRKDGSSGLGLYIVKQILDQHDTKIVVSSNEEGITFSFKT